MNLPTFHFSRLVNHDPREVPCTQIPLSLKQLTFDCDLAIRVATTCNIRTRFLKNNNHPGCRLIYIRGLPDRKGIPLGSIPEPMTQTNPSPPILPHYMLHQLKHQTRISGCPVGLLEGSLGSTQGSLRTIRTRRPQTKSRIN